MSPKDIVQRDSDRRTKLNDGYACILFSLAMTPNSSNELFKCCTLTRARAHTQAAHKVHLYTMGACCLSVCIKSYRQFSEDFRKIKWGSAIE